MQAVQFDTPGQIARRLGVPLHRIAYILATRDHIQPRARAGRIRVYDNQAVAQIRHELNAIDARTAAKSQGWGIIREASA